MLDTKEAKQISELRHDLAKKENQMAQKEKEMREELSKKEKELRDMLVGGPKQQQKQEIRELKERLDRQRVLQ